MKQKDIYLANLDPAFGREQAGERPVVIISGDTMNSNMDIVIACPMTTSLKGYYGCVLVLAGPDSGLVSDSEILTFQPRAISKKRLKKKIGSISSGQLAETLSNLVKICTY